MLSPPTSPGGSRWRLVAACGAATAVAGLASLVLARPSLVSIWLLLAGVGVAILSVQAMRKERAAGALRVQRDEAERAREAAVARSLQLADISPDLLTLHGPDGCFTHVSSASRQVLGYEPDELLGRHPDELVFPEDLPIVLAVRNRAREADDVGATIRLVRRDGRPVWTEVRVSVDRKARETQVIARDVHERVEAERALAQAEARFRTAFEEGAVGMAIVEPGGRLIRANRALAAITGHTVDELEGRPLAGLLHPEERDRSAEDAERMIRGDLFTPRGEWRYLHADGHVVWVAVTTTLVRDALGTARCTSSSRSRTSPSAGASRRELRHLADHDPLTGLLNRRALRARARPPRRPRSRRYGPRGALLVLDLDHFKDVNDTLGHSAGDQLIRRSRRRCASALRDTRRARPPRRRRVRRAAAPTASRGRRARVASDARSRAIRERRPRSPATPAGVRRSRASIGIAPFDGERS